MAAMEMDVEAPNRKSIEESVQGMYQSMVNIQESSLLMMLCLTSALGEMDVPDHFSRPYPSPLKLLWNGACR